MRNQYLRIASLLALLLLAGGTASAQNTQSTPSAPQRPAQTRQTGFDLTEYGVRIQSEPRLVVVMAALDAAGFDPTPEGESPSAFRAQVRRDQLSLDEDLRRRLTSFYKSNKLPGNATAAEQAARYVSLAYALGPPPEFEPPARSADLPAGLLDVLDFAPLVREFYKKSGMEERMPGYLRLYQAEADRLRVPTAEMVRNTLSYLHTRPITTNIERIPVRDSSTGNRKKDEKPRYTIRERERRFFIVPDLLAAPGAINLRVIADDYFATVPAGTNPTSSELRRAYLQYVVDPLIGRFNREIAERRDALKQLLDGLTASGKTVSTDVFSAVGRSLVAAADARLDETARLDALARETQARLASTSDAALREQVIKETQATRASITDEAIAQLADAYERGGVLSFYFADQLRGVESSGFDIIGSFADMIASFDVMKEGRRIADNSAARVRALEARRARQGRSASGAAKAETTGADSARGALIKKLIEVEDMLRLRNYEGAESRLRALLQEYPGEPRIFLALGEAATVQARETTDDDLQIERLNRALAHYRMAVSASTADADPALLSRAHTAMGRILAFLDQSEDAMKEFDAAIKLGRVSGGAYDEAVAGKQKLAQQK